MSNAVNTGQLPQVTDILIYVTDRCNLKCQHCYYEPTFDSNRCNGHDHEITYKQICNTIDELVPLGLGACKFSGGEPFLRDELVKLCEYLYSKKINVIIETNGTLITEDDAVRLGSIKDGLFVSVSLDSDSPEKHDKFRGVNGAFRNALRGLDYLIQNGVPTQVIAVACKDTEEEVINMMNLMNICLDHGAHSFKVNFVTPIGRAKKYSAIDPEKVLEIDSALHEHGKRIGLAYTGSVPKALLPITRLTRQDAPCGRCSICSTIGLLADGTITTCGMGRQTKGFRYGNIGKDSIAEIWLQHPLLRDIRELIPSQLKGICGKCIMRSVCLGYCRLNSEKVAPENLCDSYWMCEEMYKRGKFPSTRLYEHKKTESKHITNKTIKMKGV